VQLVDLAGPKALCCLGGGAVVGEFFGARRSDVDGLCREISTTVGRVAHGEHVVDRAELKWEF